MRFLLLLSILLANPLLAQIPNPGFESWVIGNWLLNPFGWGNPNDQQTVVVSQDSDAFEGNYAMRVNAVPTPLGAYGWAECSFPNTSIPESLDFYVKAETEFGGVSVTISFFNEENMFYSESWNSGQTISEWTLVSLPLNQIEPVMTHAVIRVEAEVGDLLPGNAWISVDAMGFDLPLNSEENKVTEKFQLYPNPAKDQLIITGLLENTSVSLVDITGKTVFETRARASQLRLDLGNLSRGIYIVNTLPPNQVAISRKLVIR